MYKKEIITTLSIILIIIFLKDILFPYSVKQTEIKRLENKIEQLEKQIW